MFSPELYDTHNAIHQYVIQSLGIPTVIHLNLSHETLTSTLD